MEPTEGTKHPFTQEALAQLGALVLEILLDSQDWHAGTAHEIAAAARSLGLLGSEANP